MCPLVVAEGLRWQPVVWGESISPSLRLKSSGSLLITTIGGVLFDYVLLGSVLLLRAVGRLGTRHT